MVLHKCEICSYSTTYTTNFYRHIQSKKHLSNIKEQKEKNTETIKKNSQNAPKMHLKCTQNAPKMHPKCTQDKVISIQDNKTCKFCDKVFTRTTGLKKHLRICKFKKVETSNDQLELVVKQMELQKEQIDKQNTEINKLKEQKISLTNNNIQNITQYNGTINYLNIHFSNVQTIEQFIDNLKNKIPLAINDRKCLLETYNECGIDAFAETFSIIMKKYQSEQVEKGILPTMPLVCTDGNLRSIKEFHENGWITTQSNSSIDKMIDISNEQIYQTENTKVFITQKERKKIHNRIKKDNTLVNMEEIKNKYHNNTKKLSPQNYQKIENSSKTEYDFSSINDDYIEKFSIKQD